jgi:predicted dehydrogenase
MSLEAKLRVGIVGCGYQGGILAKAVARSQSWQVVACADPDLEAARKLAAESGYVATYASADEMLGKDAMNMDVVFVASPHHLLCPLALAAIRAGKHVLVEKPIGVIEAEAAQLEKAASKAGVCVESGYSFRYIPSWWRVHELMEAGAVGEVQAVTGVFVRPPMLDGWLASPETGGGPLLYLGSHLIDQILWYMGEVPVEVYATVSRRPDTRADDTSAFQMRFAGGAMAQCLVSQASASVVYDRLHIYGREGHIGLEMLGFFDFEITVSSKKMPEYADEQKIRLPMADDPRMIKHVAQLEAFAQAIRENRQPPVTLADGCNVLRVIDAVFKSGEMCQPVQLT